MQFLLVRSWSWLIVGLICISLIIASQLTAIGVVLILAVMILLESIPRLLLLSVVTLFVAAVLVLWSKKSVKVILQSLILGGLVVAWSLYFWNVREASGSNRIRAIQHHLQSLHSTGEAYPDSLTSVREIRERDKGFGRFLGDKVRYSRDDDDYTLCRSQIPLGPQECYSSKHGEWYYEE